VFGDEPERLAKDRVLVDFDGNHFAACSTDYNGAKRKSQCVATVSISTETAKRFIVYRNYTWCSRTDKERIPGNHGARSTL
jgi:hypothetical protein